MYSTPLHSHQKDSVQLIFAFDVRFSCRGCRGSLASVLPVARPLPGQRMLVDLVSVVVHG